VASTTAVFQVIQMVDINAAHFVVNLLRCCEWQQMLTIIISTMHVTTKEATSVLCINYKQQQTEKKKSCHVYAAEVGTGVEFDASADTV